MAASQFPMGHLWLESNAVSKGYAVTAAVPLPAIHNVQFSFIIVDELYLCLRGAGRGRGGPRDLDK